MSHCLNIQSPGRRLVFFVLAYSLFLSAIPLFTGGAGAAPATKETLSNGMTVLLKEEHSAPIVTTMIWYRVGSKDEESGRTGLAHFLEHMMFKGTSKYHKGEIDLITLRNGGSNNAFTWTDYTAYYFTFASDRWMDALEIEADRMTGCAFLQEEFDPEKQVVIEERKIGEDSPESALSEELDAIAFKAHGYHHPTVGWMSDLETVTREDMLFFYRRYYTPGNATLVVVGDFDSKKALEKVRQLFGERKKGDGVIRIRTTEPPQRGERRLILEMSANVPRVSVAHRTVEAGHKDNFPLILIEKILAQGRSSRLYQKLVAELGIATSVAVERNDFKEPYLFVVRCELKPEVSAALAESVIVSELEKLSMEDIGPDELQKAKRLAESEFVFGSESTMSQAIRLGAWETILSHTFLDTYLENILKVTPEEIRSAAGNYFTRRGRIIGWVIPEAETSFDLREEKLEGENLGFSGNDVLLEAKWLAGAGRTSGLNYPPSLCKGIPREPTRTGAHEKYPSSSKSELRFKAPKPIKKTLPNGMTLIAFRKSTTPTVSISAYVRTGSRNDPEGKAGLASYVGRMLKEGTRTRTSFEIASEIESIGGSISTSTTSSFTHVSSSALSKDLDVGLSLVSDILRNPAFDREVAERERSKLLAEIRASNDSPRSVGRRSFGEIVYGTHPLSHPVDGYEPTVQGITSEDLKEFHRTHYAPESTYIIVVGDISISLVEKKVLEYFGSWRQGKLTRSDIPEAQKQGEKRTKYVKMDKEQINIFLGHLGIKRDNPDYYALQVMDVILGFSGLFTSRIISNLRDTQGLAYSTYSDITSSSGIDPGVFVAYIGTSPGNKEKAIDGLLTEIRRIREEPVSVDELENAKRYLTGSFVFDFETNTQLASYFFESQFFGLGEDYITRYPGLIEGLAARDILRVAQKYLDPDNYSLVVVGRVDERGNILKEEK